ncbi:sialin-like isoform X1 [Neodiprion virginianus]|uniref:sialin-like isoform X1 n=2 Tax=Neodiprion virginianus TaxID=2961670 RepID=UPI001EE6C19C|nr:sialin-like isoform X1 [Neodiprion virginianus]XP_046608977.1 sialin-like isoform X1 [Neodiprion virginianus]XP_046608978.1 sialin-like isoform X1 [Neodiprion virginianus]
MVIAPEKLVKEKECFSCRDVLWYLVFSGFAVSYMIKLHLSLTIIAMVVAPQLKATTLAQCAWNEYVQKSNSSSLWTNATSLTNSLDNNTTNTSLTSWDTTQTLEHSPSQNETQSNHRFSWNEYDQGVALGAYSWLHPIMQLPAGFLAHRYGTKLIFGLTIFIPATLGFMTPVLARYHFYAFVLLRALQGGIADVCWSAVNSMTAKWIPIDDRSKFLSAYFGGAVGTAIVYPMCAILINSFGWDSVFYVTSALGIIWCVAWYYLAFDTPQEHPRISVGEKTYILERLGNSVNITTSQKIPWKAILTSRPLWIVTIAHVGYMWGITILYLGTPSYFNYIHGWNIQAVGMLSAIPQVLRMLFSYTISSFSDWLLKTERMPIMWLRKAAVFLGCGIPSIMLLGLAFSGCHPTLAIAFMMASLIATGATSAGTLAVTVDLSPNYASILFGIKNTISSFVEFLAPMMIGILTNNNQTIVQWRLVFLITVAIMFSTSAVYIFFGTSEVQHWNYQDDEEDPVELENLRSKVNKAECEETTAYIPKKRDNCSYSESAECCVAEMND